MGHSKTGYPSSAGGADLSALGFVEVDLTDGFTLTDPDSLVSATSNAAGVNKVTFNALSSGSTDYAWGAGTNQRAPRWVKSLTAPDSSDAEQQIQSGDAFILQTVLEFSTPDNRFATEIVVASSVDGTSTAAAANDAMGGICRYNTTGNISYGIYTFNGYAALANASNARSTCTVLHAGARGQGGAYVNLDSSGDAITGGSRNASMDYTDGTTSMQLMIGVGTNGSATITAGDDAQFRAWYRVVRFTLPT